MTRLRDGLALGAALGTGVQVGAAMVATRIVAHDVGPASLAMLRYVIAVLCLLPFLLAAPRFRFPPRDFIAVAGLGIVQFGVLIMLLNFGLRYMPAGRAALLFATFPLLTMIIAAALGRETMTWAKTAGVLLTIAGVGVTLGERLLHQPAAGEWLGAGLVLASALCGAVCSVLYRPYLERCPTLPVGVLAMFASVVFLAGFAGFEGLFSAPLAIGLPGWGAIVFIGLSSGAGYLLWLYALKHASPTRVTVFLAMSPVTAALLGVVILDEPVTTGNLIGLATVAGGLWLATGSLAERRLKQTARPH